LRQAFLAIATAEPHRCVVVDGTQPSKLVDDTIWNIVEGRFLMPQGTASIPVREPAAP
jgi:dTMP kinase